MANTPEPPSPARQVNWEIRSATEADFPDIVSLFGRAAGASAWTQQGLAAYLCLVAVCREQVVGAAVARPLVEGEAELLNLAVGESHRRQGLAQALIRQLFLFLPGEWFLEVRESNRAAMQLYDSLGFTFVSKRTSYYPDTGEAAIVMRCSAW